MNITCFDDLLSAARQQPEPQRLLFVFVGAELPEDATEEEKARFESGEGGALVPVVCVDKGLDELEDFEQLAEESRHTGKEWVMVFAAGMSGRAGIAPSSDEAIQPLNMMVEAIRLGHIGQFLAFDREGDVVAFC
ncbi:MAG: ribonucleotide reductase subunit alpha [Gammaproteobacteria bacterium]|nr:ribonucleotide reductase subunit alpha [Gammaproteobacteria bacterium]